MWSGIHFPDLLFGLKQILIQIFINLGSSISREKTGPDPDKIHGSGFDQYSRIHNSGDVQELHGGGVQAVHEAHPGAAHGDRQCYQVGDFL